MQHPSAFPGGVADFLQNPMVAGAAAQYGKEIVDTQLGKYRDKVSRWWAKLRREKSMNCVNCKRGY